MKSGEKRNLTIIEKITEFDFIYKDIIKWTDEELRTIYQSFETFEYELVTRILKMMFDLSSYDEQAVNLFLERIKQFNPEEASLDVTSLPDINRYLYCSEKGNRFSYCSDESCYANRSDYCSLGASSNSVQNIPFALIFNERLQCLDFVKGKYYPGGNIFTPDEGSFVNYHYLIPYYNKGKTILQKPRQLLNTAFFDEEDYLAGDNYSVNRANFQAELKYERLSALASLPQKPVNHEEYLDETNYIKLNEFIKKSYSKAFFARMIDLFLAKDYTQVGLPELPEECEFSQQNMAFQIMLKCYPVLMQLKFGLPSFVYNDFEHGQAFGHGWINFVLSSKLKPLPGNLFPKSRENSFSNYSWIAGLIADHIYNDTLLTKEELAIIDNHYPNGQLLDQSTPKVSGWQKRLSKIKKRFFH